MCDVCVCVCVMCVWVGGMCEIRVCTEVVGCADVCNYKALTAKQLTEQLCDRPNK